MAKGRSGSYLLTLIFLIGAVLLVQRAQQHKPVAVQLEELTRSAEAGSSVAEEHFSPGEDIERIDVARLEQAKSSVDIAMYAFTDQYIADALKQLAERGVKVRIYRDQQQYEEEQNHASKKDSDSTTSLLTGLANVQVRVKGKRELMHLKAYVIDGTVLRDGSANWSPSGEKRQDNNAHFTADPAQVKAFQRDFDEMWGRTDNLIVQ
ncbi:nuclease-related protein [Candidatus Koribacter versatilis Ellin345]|uniref:phospholipase D n=1 Tax=Koribacter versatilis (strain Ellin345) TaxID=204669 RepID=Q1IHF5_KORVE|nr:phospholipase D-like domain-containing protein [Candidatus Koribacter versatilis]ABF43695.1 nuclease-related protein [Candidatus Koribacter versatilis Ellin345]